MLAEPLPPFADHYNAVISKQDWADTYSQPFQAAVVGANASGLMCSYNAMTLEGYLRPISLLILSPFRSTDLRTPQL